MLHSMKRLRSFNVLAENGECGQVSDMLFDDLDWRLRYLVADTGSWLPGREVLLPNDVLGEPDPGAEVFPVELNREDIRESPPVSADEPVSRQKGQRMLFHGSRELHPHVVRSQLDGPASWVVPVGAIPETELATSADKASKHGDIHLRSADEVLGYGVGAGEGKRIEDIGTVDDLILDPETWVLRYAVIDTGQIFPGTKKILAMPWVSQIDYDTRQVHVDVSRDAVKNSPEFDPSSVMDRSYEEAVYQYYQRRRYWE